MIEGLLGSTTAMLERVLDRASTRMGVLSSNIANIDTPGYIPVDLSPEDPFARHLEMASTEPGHRQLDQNSATLTYDLSTQPGEDGNAVDLDREMAKLASNNQNFDLGSRLLAKKMAMLRYAIDNDR